MQPGRKRLTYVFRRIYLLLWKNVLFRKRHYIVTTFEIILPTILAGILAFLRTQLDEGSYKVVDRVSMFPPTTEQELLDYTTINILCDDCVFAYAPSNPLTDEILKRLKDKVSQSEFALKGFETERKLEEFAEVADLKSAYDDPKLKSALVFDGLDDPDFVAKAVNGSFPDGFNFRYRLRPAAYDIHTESIFQWFQFPGPELENAAKYTLGGHSGVQILLDRVLIELLTGVETTQEIQTQVFPYPPYIEVKDFSQFYFIFLPLFLVLGFIFIVPSTIRNVVSERESGIKELMKLMGLPTWMHWLGWMMNSLLILCFSISIVVFMLFYPFNPKTGPVIGHSSAMVWWLVLLLFVMAATSFCFFISTFSERPTLATTLGVVIWLVSYFGLAVPLEANYMELTLTEKLSAAIIPNMGLHWAIKVMCGFEGKASGALWSNFWEPLSDVDGLSVGNICAMFVLDIIVYSLLTLYLEAILPSKYGIRKPWYFLFKPSTYVTPKKKVDYRRQSIYSLQETTKPGFEPDPDSLNPGVVIHELTKKFGKKKVAVNKISIKMYEGQITALLGHNGAGKTTTMSMLTGLFPPTSGNAYLSGFDIKHQLNEARESLGLCPQHNMLFDQLTVMEHLIFFGRIKGLSAPAAMREARTLLKKLQLSEKKHCMSQDLSGGQKRKLCLGMALIGGTKVVILDEPTSGMDPEARRVIWDLLLEMRGKRTIVLTTHFMEEADILGDRVAIMTHGNIECYGTPMFLKKYYGTGYTLKMTTQPKINAQDILKRVQKHLPKSFLKTEHSPNSSELAISIPSEEDTTATFPSMFLDLNNEKESLGILTIGLSLTTMDEVFIKIGEENESTDGESNHSELHNGKDERSTSFSAMNGDRNGSRTHLQDDKLQGMRLVTSQILGLLKKKMIYSLRKRKLLITQFIISPLLVIGAIYLSNSTSNPSVNSPALTMSLSSYNKPQTLFFAENDSYAEIYKASVGDRGIRIKEDLLGQLVTLGAVDLGKFRQEYIVGAEFNETIITALFSSIPYHAAPLSVNLVTNAILKAVAPNKDFGIQTAVHPLQNELFNILEAALPNPALWFFSPIIFGAFVPIGLALFAASYIVFPIEERTSKAKQLQLMTGVNTIIFWGTSFLWDLLLIFIAILVIVLCFPIFQTDGEYTANDGLFVMFLVLVVWGFSSLSFAYFFSFLVSTPAGGFALKTVLNIIFGMLLPIILFVINNFQKELDTNPISYVGRILPTFGASASIMRYASLAKQNSRCAILSPEDKKLFCNPDLEVDPQLLQCCDNCANFTNPFGPSCFVPEDFFGWTYKYDKDTTVDLPGIPQEIFWMLMMGIFYQLIFILIEFGGVRRIIWRLFCRTAPKRFANPVQDEDVLNEKSRVKELLQNGKSNEDGFLVTNLSKSYGNFAAVANLNFGVHHGECFGLLGVNGAGKTTTFKMITGDEIPSSGNAYGCMRTLQNHRKEFLSNIGYCPQFDATIGVLTGREMLSLFASIRGVPPSKKEAEVSKWLKKLGLLKAGNVKSEKYSGGMKRRLSVAMAMIGDSPIILLDEPTSGVDPVARRQFWDVISSLKGSGQCVILTSHSMEECEALCSRLGIMVNGQLQCLGGVQHLKSKFAKGFSLVLRLKPDIHADDPAAFALKKDISQRLQPCELKDEHQNVIQYQIQNTEMPWNLIFEIVEECKGLHADIIEDYSVSETTLEEVFLSFARKQYQGRNVTASCCWRGLTCGGSAS